MPDAGQVTSHRRRRRRRWAVVAVALVALGVAIAVYGAVRILGSQGSDSTPDAGSSPTPLASMDLSGLPIDRSSPCSHLDERAVATALGGDLTVAEHYAPGDRVRLDRGLRDLSAEFGCNYRDAEGAEARVWVFEQPVKRVTAAGIVRDARAEKGCRTVQRGPGFGTPTITTSCPLPHSRGRVVTARGLFDDTWLTCQLALPRDAGADDPVRRTQRWCVSVVTGLGARG
jgi:hypothetical protein